MGKAMMDITNGVVEASAKKLNLSENCVKRILGFRDKILKDKYISELGISPRAFLAGLIYVSAELEGETRTKTMVSNALAISSISILKAQKIILHELDMDLGITIKG